MVRFSDKKTNAGLSQENSRNNAVDNGTKKLRLGESRFYFFEYALLLLVVIISLSMLQAMGQFFISGSLLTPFYWYFDLSAIDIFLVSLSLVVLPLIYILAYRTGNSERKNPGIKNSSWRKAFLGIFLAIVSVWAVLSTVIFVNTILGYFYSGVAINADFDWQRSLLYFGSSVVLITTVWVFISDYRNSPSPIMERYRNLARYGLLLGAVSVVFFFVMFPLYRSRNLIIDSKITEDILLIQEKVGNYTNDNGGLPDGLNDLDLSKDQKQRANEFGYTYEKRSDDKFILCAIFKTDAGKDYYSGIQATGQELSSSYTDSGVYMHTSGQDCFDFDARVYSYTSEPMVEGESSYNYDGVQAVDGTELY